MGREEEEKMMERKKKYRCGGNGERVKLSRGNTKNGEEKEGGGGQTRRV